MKKRIKPIVKFNNGSPVLLCNDCSVIIKGNLTKDEIRGKTDILYCDKCTKNNTKSINLCKI